MHIQIWYDRQTTTYKTKNKRKIVRTKKNIENFNNKYIERRNRECKKNISNIIVILIGYDDRDHIAAAK